MKTLQNHIQSKPQFEPTEFSNSSNFITELTKNEFERQKNCLNLIASENLPSPKVLELMGSVWSNKYGEGYPGKRYYAGNQFTDELESFVQKKALEVFDTQKRFGKKFGNLENKKLKPEFLGSTSDYAVNVQVLSGSPANSMVFLSVLNYGDTILSLNLANGGHLSHLHATSNWNKFFKLVNYNVKLVENTENQKEDSLKFPFSKGVDALADGVFSSASSTNLEQIINKIQKLQTQNSKDNSKNQSKHKENIDFIKREIHKIKTLNLENPKVEFFASSQCNDLYLVTKNNFKYLAKIANWEQNKTWKIKQEEFEKLNFIKEFKIAPTSYYFDLGNNSEQIHWNLVDFIEGNPIKSFSSDNIIQLAKILRKLHDNTISDKFGDRWNKLEKTPYKCYILDEYLEKFPKFTEKLGFYDLKKRFGEINWQEIKQFCLIHKDLKALNIVEKDGQIRLIDWEYAYMDIPENDVARFFVENSLTENQKKLFLEDYLPLEILDFKMERLEILVRLYEFFEIGKDAVEPIYNENLNSQKPFIIAIDGRGGSGKSTLSQKLAEKLDCELIPKDKYFYFEENLDLNQESVDCQNFTWKKNEFLQDIKNYQKSVIIIEGCSSFQIEEMLVIDLKIWVNLDEKISSARGQKRNTNNFPTANPKALADIWRQIVLWQEKYIIEQKPQQKADLVISTENGEYEILGKFDLLDYQIYAQNAERFILPILKKFENKDKKLWYFGVNHSYDSNNEMFVQIENSFKLLKPELVVLEGSLKINSLTKNYKKEILSQTKEDIITKKGEFGLGLYLALQNSTEVFCPEPTFIEQVNFLEKYYKKEEIFCSFIITMADQYSRLINEKRALQEYLEEEIMWQKKNLEDLENWSSFDFSYLSFLKSFEEIVGFNFGQTKPEFWKELDDPINWKNKKFKWNILNDLVKENSNFRDRFILMKIQQKIQNYNKILIIYGGSHLYVQEKSLSEIISKNSKNSPLEEKNSLIYDQNNNIISEKNTTNSASCFEIDEADFEVKLIEFKPKLTILGGSSYPRLINFARLTEIAHKHGSLVLADVAHINGLIASGLHFSPFQSGELANFGADFVTMTTHKTLRGPRGAMIFMKKEWEKTINKTIFPGTSGGPHFNKIAAIGQSCLEILGEDSYPDGVSFEKYSQNVLETCKALENSLAKSGLEIISPTQNHLCLVKLPEKSE